MQALNADPAVDAMLVQYPGPPQVDFDAVLLAVDPDKDVDGMHPTNVGRLALGIPGPVACTPAGIEALLAHYEVPVAGRDVVIVGRGRHHRPAAEHPAVAEAARPPTPPSPSCTPACADWAEHTRRADILIAAAGVPGMIQPEHIKPGGVVVGAGVQYEGRKLLPDVDESCEEVAGWITPRVGGVGPTTIALLFRNFVEAAERHASAACPAPSPSSRPSRSRGTSPQVSDRRRPPDADHDAARRRACTGEPWDDEARAEVVAPSSTAWRPSGTRAPAPPRDAVVADALDRGVGDRGGDVCVELGSGHRRVHAGARRARRRRVLATEVSLEMLLLASRRDVGHRVLADGARLPLHDGAADAVVLVNCFLFPAEVDRVLAPEGVVVWVNSSGGETPIHLPPEEVDRSAPGPVGGRAGHAPGVGIWCALRRAS